MEKGRSSVRTVPYTKGCTKMGRKMGMESLKTQISHSIRVIGQMVRDVDLESVSSQMGQATKGSGKMIK